MAAAGGVIAVTATSPAWATAGLFLAVGGLAAAGVAAVWDFEGEIDEILDATDIERTINERNQGVDDWLDDILGDAGGNPDGGEDPCP